MSSSMETSMAEPTMMEEASRSLSIIWYRHGLRMHDNPALIEALKENDKSDLLPVFIFDGESAGTKLVGYNRMRFLIESLEDLNESFNKFNNGALRILRGDPVQLFAEIHQRTPIRKLCFEQDYEPIWKPRDTKVKRFCEENGIQVVECVSHSLWDPSEILEANGGTPPLTHAAFLFVVSTLPKPPRPLDAPDPKQMIRFYENAELPGELVFPISPETFGVEKEDAVPKNYRQGGEQNALALLEKRLIIERAAFEKRRILPNHSTPDLTMGISMSPALRFGNISVRKVYWAIQDLFNEVLGWQLKNSDALSNQTYVGQLFWREYFYVMSVPNPYYDQMKPNPICLNIPWSTDLNAKENLKLWKEGRTGYPFIDAGMRQLLQEGWQHHVMRNAVACFLTRGDLWISWEEGLKHFLKYLLDADWSVCAGNWMWVSSSAFENILDCSQCVCPTNYAQRLDPEGNFIIRYLPELKNYPPPYIFEPWKTPIELQHKWGCVIGRDYPEPIVDHDRVSKINKEEMTALRNRLQKAPEHMHPFDEREARAFMWLPDNCGHH